jgi:hypothetical protein
MSKIKGGASKWKIDGYAKVFILIALALILLPTLIVQPYHHQVPNAVPKEISIL